MDLQKIRGRIIAGEQIHLQRKEFYEKPSNIALAVNTTVLTSGGDSVDFNFFFQSEIRL